MKQLHLALLIIGIASAFIIFKLSFTFVQYQAPYSSFEENWWKYLLGIFAIAVIYVLLTG